MANESVKDSDVAIEMNASSSSPAPSGSTATTAASTPNASPLPSPDASSAGSGPSTPSGPIILSIGGGDGQSSRRTVSKTRKEEALEASKNRRRERNKRWMRVFMCWCCPLYMCLAKDGGCDDCCPCCNDTPYDERSENPWAPRPKQKRAGAL